MNTKSPSRILRVRGIIAVMFLMGCGDDAGTTSANQNTDSDSNYSSTEIEDNPSDTTTIVTTDVNQNDSAVLDSASSSDSADAHTLKETDTVDTAVSTDDSDRNTPVLVGDCSYPDDYADTTVTFSYLWGQANSMGYEGLNRIQEGCNHEDVTCLEYPGTVIRSLDGWLAVFGEDQPLLVDIEGESELDTALHGIDWDNTTLIVTSTGGGGMGSWRMEPRFHRDNQNQLRVTIHIWQPVVPEVDTDIGWSSTAIVRVDNGAAPIALEMNFNAPCTMADVEPFVSSYN